LGNLDERVWSDCSKFPDYGIISFSKVENPARFEACLPNRSSNEIYRKKNGLLWSAFFFCGFNFFEKRKCM
jgi:hypothetical protein